jgi:hypothetical protein
MYWFRGPGLPELRIAICGTNPDVSVYLLVLNSKITQKDTNELALCWTFYL